MTEPDQSPDLDRFEGALLASLRTRVADRPTTRPGPVPSAPGGGPRRPRAVPALAAVCAVVVGGAVFSTVVPLGPEPAYAVSRSNDGAIIVQVNRLEGPQRLEAALADQGVEADITYLEPGGHCLPDRYTDRSPRGLVLSVGAEDFEVTIPPGGVTAQDTFVLSASVDPRRDGTGLRAEVDFGITDDPVVAPCRP